MIKTTEILSYSCMYVNVLLYFTVRVIHKLRIHCMRNIEYLESNRVTKVNKTLFTRVQNI